MPNRYWKGNERTKRDRFVEMLKPLLLTGWFTSGDCMRWLKDNCVEKNTPTARELAPCISRHPNIQQRKRKKNEWRWVE